jgi:type IV pilus assembly protein PilA
MLKKLNKKKNQKGFTLVELLIVIAIIGILAAIAIPQFSSYRAKAYMTQVRSDVKNAYTAATAYFADNPSATAITIADLQNNGFRGTPPVTVGVTSGNSSGFSLSGSSSQCNGTYAMTAAGAINDSLTQ